jgi:hypothetical protein
VADAKRFRVPHGRNKLLMNAMGLTNRSQLSHYRAVLTLPDEVWQIGDDFNVPDEILYRLAGLSPERAIEEARKIVVAHNNSGPARSTAVRVERQAGPGTGRYFAQVTRAITLAGPGKQAHNEKALQRIEQLEAWLADQKRRIQGYLP